MDVNVAHPILDTETMVAEYVALRDKIATAKKAFDERLKPAAERLQELHNQLLTHLNNNSCDSVRTAAGTFYRNTQTTASLADADAFRNYIVENQLWHLVDWRANAAQIRARLDVEPELPPGVNFSMTDRVGVRRA